MSDGSIIFTAALIASISFGAWNGSVFAALFMFGFFVVMKP